MYEPEKTSGALGYSGLGPGSSRGYINEGVPTRQSDIEAVRAALSHARELASYSSELVALLVGYPPESASDSAVKDYVPSGMLPAIGKDARDTVERISGAMSELRRLSGSFPQQP